MNIDKSCITCEHYLKGNSCPTCTGYSNWQEYVETSYIPTTPDLTIFGPIPKPFINLTKEQKENIGKGVEEFVQGKKFDTDKVDWTLMPWKELEQVLEILEFGAKKYSKDNWKNVEPARYEKAAMRHLISYVTGEKKDSETNKSHLAHLICNALFLMWNNNK